jgi:hopanoid biosynthesis associated protein HpnK
VRRVIINGDDFGLAVPVNEAIVEAHRRGVLTTASLMVGEAAAADAIERARRTPSLKVGLHLVLVEGRSILPPQAIPNLVNSRGEFSDHPARSGFKYALWPGIRKQLEVEIRAQFEAFRKTGLPLDHVDSHNHLHLHPRILNLILKVGREYGLSAIRLPREPALRSWRAAGKSLVARLSGSIFLAPLLWMMKRRLLQYRVRSNDFLFGMMDTGAMTTDLAARFLQQLPEGVTEIYFHPATRRCEEIDRTMPAYRHVEEFQALTSRTIHEMITSAGIQRIAFSDL